LTPEVQHWFVKCEQLKGAMLAEVSAWSAERQNFRATPESWSAVCVLDHLVKVDRGVLDNIRHHLPAGRPVRFKNVSRGAMVFVALALPTRVGIPTGAGPIGPEENAQLPVVTAQWNEVRSEISELLNSLQPEQFRTGLFRHPLSGWMNLHRTMQFLYIHMFHHKYQLARIRRASRTL
jgi:DinB family protein